MTRSVGEKNNVKGLTTSYMYRVQGTVHYIMYMMISSEPRYDILSMYIQMYVC